jgi:hypothetical protein
MRGLEMAGKQVLKDKKIGVYKHVSMRDSEGFQTTGYMPIHEQASIWAYFKQLSASLLYANNSTTDKEDCLFRINWNEYVRHAYASDLSIYYQGIVYQVTRIDPFEDYTRDLVLYAKTTKTSKLEPVFPYDPSKL